jgi:hypothetical protein
MSGARIENWPIGHSRLHSVIPNNKLIKIEKTPIFIQGRAAVPPDKDPVDPQMVRDNIVFAHIVGNHVSNADDIIVNDGLPTNYVNIVEGSQPHARKSIDYDWS